MMYVFTHAGKGFETHPDVELGKDIIGMCPGETIDKRKGFGAHS